MQSVSLSPRLRDHVEHYAASHRTAVNKALHFIGIPLLLISSYGLLAKLAMPVTDGNPALQPNLAWAALLVAAYWYLRADGIVGILTLGVVTACYALGSNLGAVALAAMFGAGALLHMVGHYGFEGKPPAFFERPMAVLEAPAWLIACWGGWEPTEPSSDETRLRQRDNENNEG